MIRILIVEDDDAIARLMALSLGKHGYHCEIVGDGLAASDRVENASYDLVLLDVMLPGVDGFTLMEYLREYRLPVIFITARAAVADRVKGLRLGADDYLVKPFDISELVARVEAVLRRYHRQEGRLQWGEITVDTDLHTVTRRGQAVDLTLKEYDLLVLFLQNRGIALYRETIYERVWGELWRGDTRTVDLHVQRLRKKLGLSSAIQTVNKVGYRLADTDGEAPR